MGLLEGKTCIVTGAGGDIGSEICRVFAKEGAEKIFAAEHREGSVEAWKSRQEGPFDCIEPYTLEITEEAGIKQFVQQIRKQKRKIDVLVNVAGIEYNENIGMISYPHMRQMFETNVFGLIEMTQYAARLMMRQNSGSILNIASVVGVYGNPGQSVYSATKGAVISFTRSAAKELAAYGIRVNAVAPGLTETRMIKETDPEKLEKRLERISLNRMAKPEDVADMAAFLCSERAEYITGQVIGVDGGTIM